MTHNEENKCKRDFQDTPIAFPRVEGTVGLKYIQFHQHRGRELRGKPNQKILQSSLHAS
uniref:Uncharacterized protein n=1 Tax=Anopheles christyi TaxID=43041 RepID=A0A182KHF5_9DIPT